MSDAPALYTRNVGLADTLAARYAYPGADHDDVRQTARIALWDASRRWQAGRGATFPTFASLVIRRQLATGLKLARARKHLALSDSIRDGITEDGYRLPVVDLLADPSSRVEDAVIARDQLRRITAALPTLTPLERAAIAASVNDLPLAGKQDDNARMRARRKLREAA